MNKPTLKSVSVKQLYTYLDGGKFAVPKLQRAFVWNGNKAAKLLDSICRGMPIGSVIVWDTGRKNRNMLRQSLHILPPFNDYNKRVWFVLDGQQRLSVLHQIRKGGERENGSRRLVDFDRVVFRVAGTDGAADFQYRKPVPGAWVPLSTVLSPNWRVMLRGLSAGQLARVRRCRERIRGYRVPIVSVESDSLEDARELFIRINSLGTPLGAADRAFARASEFDLRELAEQTWQQLPHKFRKVRYEILLQTLALVEGVGDVGERAFETVIEQWDARLEEHEGARAEFNKTWKRLSDAILLSLEYLNNRFNVLDDGLLPSEYMIATLSIFFFSRGSQPTAWQRREIKKWFWATSLGQRYSGRGFRENILKDAEYFERLARRGAARFAAGELLDPSDLTRTVYGQRSSVADAFYCLLVSNSPLYLADGEKMPVDFYASQGSRKHKHHIFPRDLLRRHGVPSRRANSIVNICFVPARDNSVFGSRRPSVYLEEYRDRRHFKRALRSHLIPDGEVGGLWDDNVYRGYNTFLRERTRRICRAFEAAAGCKLFRKD
ncbi:MAG TPA: DUF262 domain-containing protein [Pyrinomonadaceae bacterium]